MSILEPMPLISRRQAEVLYFFGQHFARYRQAPSAVKIREHLGLSDGTNISPYLQPLVKQGYLERSLGSGKRSLKLTFQGAEMLGILAKDREEIGELKELLDSLT